MKWRRWVRGVWSEGILSEMHNNYIEYQMFNKPASKEAPLSSTFRKYQHRRIHTEIEEPGSKPLQSQYNRPINKQYSRPKFLDSNINRLPFKDNAPKTYRFTNKPHILLSRNLRNDPSEEPTESNLTTRHASTKYEVESVAGRGTFGVVYQGRVRLTGQKIAMKKVLQDKKYKNRELDILKQVKHTNILEMKDYFITHEKDQEYLNVVMDYYPDNLYQVIKKNQLNHLLIKLYSYQIIRGLNYLSLLSISHRDIKPQNILVDKDTHSVVICDFGSAKKLVKGEPNIAYICSRCYRAPQLIFGATQYTNQIDMWSTGCVIVQMINGQAPFQGDSQIDQLLEIIKTIGTPSRSEIQEMNPKYDLKQYKKFPNIKATPWNKILKTDDPLLVDLIKKIMVYSPERRLTPAEAMKHPFFQELKDPECLKVLKKCPPLFNYSEEQKASLQFERVDKSDYMSAMSGSLNLEVRRVNGHNRKRSELR